MDYFVVCGGKRLAGEIKVDTAKNALLPIIAACILTEEEIIIKNIPNLIDVNKMFEILKSMGAEVKRDKETAIVKASLKKLEIPRDLAKDIRSSIFMLGPMLAKYKIARVPYPGGCDIGSRPIDLHLSALNDLGAKIEEDHGYINCNSENMKAGVVHLDFPSVGATENIMMSAVFLKGKTTILNSAKEPEIVDLANFINKLGGKISGAGTSTIVIEGVKSLSGGEYSPISDRIVSGTYLIAAAMTKGSVALTNVNYQDIYALLNKLKNAGCEINYSKDKISLKCDRRPIACASIETQPFPGFPTDLQAQMLAMQTISEGISLVTENLFETRFKHVSELLKMGARVTIKDRMAIVRGVKRLYGAEVFAHDLRGCAGLILAGLVAKGETIVHNAWYVDRGYDKIEEKLSTLGAEIRRMEK